MPTGFLRELKLDSQSSEVDAPSSIMSNKSITFINDWLTYLGWQEHGQQSKMFFKLLQCF